MEDNGSTLPRRQLGRYLLDWRTRAGFSQVKAAELLEIGSSSLQRLEKGLNGRIRVRDVEAACDLYGVPEELTAAFVGLARQANVKSWWHEYGDLIPRDFNVYVGLETAAVKLVSYQPELVPGLLQTPDYVRGLTSRFSPTPSSADLDRWAGLKNQRQQAILRKKRPIVFETVIGEAALRRVSGSSKTMAAQLRHIADISTRPNVTVQVLPFHAGFPEGMALGPFVILDFGTTATGQAAEPPVVYLEGGTVGDMYLEKSADVNRYYQSYHALQQAALDGPTTRILLRQLAKEHYA
ncbi:helix-turn-helix domain-containing protein [Nocardia donostiensis]|uniref:Transcriptional regulator n=1 Tax=Nocardia donostiensis TaxID=1538463 RepID=A0A1W0BJY6_9NOCA|nr:helix-turn-helix transcriptional regulator [Nocardia donostiensis]ONM48892.1 transcriptional regulator [Nocardia donostiensis]OQS22852.1 transcriptional regulator [Nocardia donostiensis]